MSQSLRDSNQKSIEPLSNEYDHQPHDITFLLNDLKDQFMAPNGWKKPFFIKRNHEISLDVGTA
jgi:hypothetical protein